MKSIDYSFEQPTFRTPLDATHKLNHSLGERLTLLQRKCDNTVIKVILRNIKKNNEIHTPKLKQTFKLNPLSIYNIKPRKSTLLPISRNNIRLPSLPTITKNLNASKNTIRKHIRGASQNLSYSSNISPKYHAKCFARKGMLSKPISLKIKTSVRLKRIRKAMDTQSMLYMLYP